METRVLTAHVPTPLAEKVDELAKRLARLHAFLSPVNPRAAASAVRLLVSAPERLRAHPRLGEKLEEFEPREVRGMFVGNYEMRYEIRECVIYILRLWRSREDR